MKGVTFKQDENLTITSDMEIFDISMYKSKLEMMSLDTFVAFVKGCEKLVRKHPDYDYFVSQIRELHMDHCQVLGNIDRYSAKLEIHHGPLLTLFDYCAIVTNAKVKREEPITTFLVAKEVLNEHFKEHVQVVVLSKTVHQMIDTGEIFINLNQGIGNVNEFLKDYHDGLDEKYKTRINEYIELSKKYESTDNQILDLSDKMVSWSYRNLSSEIKDRV